MLPIFSCALLLLGTTQTLSPPHLAATPTSIDQADVLVDKIEHSTLPAHMAGLTLTSTEHCKRDRSDPFGNHSVVFNYEADDGSTYLLSYDFPYVGGWHELSFCYTGIGWQLQDRSVTALRTNDDRRFDTAQLELLKPSGDHALVTFCANYLDGTPVPATDESIWGTVYSAFTRREVEQRGVSYQIQVVTSSASGLSEKHRQTSNALIKEAYTLLATATSRVAPRP